MKPRADFVCLSRSCGDDGNVYELPVDATHCPKGHKRLRRLFNKVNIIGTRPAEPALDMRLTSSSHAVRANALLRDGFDQWEKGTSVSDPKMRSSAELPPELAQRLGVPQVMRPSQRGIGEAGIGKPMQALEVERAIKHDYADKRVPERIRRLAPPLKVMRQMNQEPIPTRMHRDPRGEA